MKVDDLTPSDIAILEEMFPIREEVILDEESRCDCGGPHCEVCGCCDHNGCEGGCIWASPTLCSRCALEQAKGAAA